MPKNGNFPSLKALVESGMAIGGVTDGKTSVNYMVDTFTGEVYPSDAKEQMAQWYEDFWKDIGRKGDLEKESE